VRTILVDRYQLVGGRHFRGLRVRSRLLRRRRGHRFLQVGVLVDANEQTKMSTNHLTIDLVTERPATGATVLYLVEQGPWPNDRLEAELRRVQDRLYNCVDALVDGQFARTFPESMGKPAVIRLDCYDTPEKPVRAFFERFKKAITDNAEIQRDIRAK